eukprot:gene911-993_t
MATTDQANVGEFVDGAVQLSLLKEEAKSELLDILSCSRGRKSLIYDLQIEGLLFQIIPEGSKFLKENGVDYFRPLKSDLDQFLVEVSKNTPDHFLYLLRPYAESIQIIAQQINALVKIGARSQFKIYFLPSQSTLCMHLLEEQVGKDVMERVTFKEYKMGLIPFDSDLLTLEDGHIFRECHSTGDFSSLNTMAQALQKIQLLYGVIPNVKCKGSLSRKVVQQLFHLRKEEEEFLERDHSSAQSSNIMRRSGIDTMILLDRDIDLVSPLVTPLTYEGLIDDTIGIEHCRIKVEAQLLGADEPEPSLVFNAASNKLETKPAEAKSERRLAPDEKVTVVLNSSDSIYAEIRNLSIEGIGPYMQEKAIHIRERYAAFKENKDASLAEIHAFVKKIPKLTKDFKSLNQHIHIAELLKNHTSTREFRRLWQDERGILEGENYLDELEELVYSDCVERKQFYRVLRLLSLQSLCSGGIKASKYDSLRKAIIQVYGIEHLQLFHQLERVGLIKKKESLMVVDNTSSWQILRKQLRLIDDKVNMVRPQDISFVAAGFAPLSARIVQMLSQAGSRQTVIDAMRSFLPGDFLEVIQHAHKPEELSDLLAKTPEATASSGALLSGGLTASLFQQVLGSSSSANNANSALSLDDALALSASSGVMENQSANSAENKKVMLVVILGGLSFLELSAFRFLSSEPQFPFRIVVATTKLINGSSMLRSLQQG